MDDYSLVTQNNINKLNKIKTNFSVNISKDSDNYLKHLYTSVIKLYSSIDYSNVEISCSVNKIKIPELYKKKEFLGLTMESLIYLLNINKLNDLLITYDKKDANQLIYTLKNKDFKGCVEWINCKGDVLMDNLNHIFQNELNIDTTTHNKFVSLDIQKYIETQFEYQFNYTIKYKKYTIKLVILEKKNKMSISKKKLKRIIKKIILMCLVKKTIHNVNITIIPTNFKKKLNRYQHNIIGSREINSGLTSFGDNNITIFREEEMEKVLIHELIHLLNLDFNHIYIDSSNIHRLCNINPKNKIILNESYTEIITILINSFINSFESSKKLDYNLVKKMIYYEIKFNLTKISKILNYYGFVNTEQFFTNYNNNLFQQKTSVFSYFIVKTSLLFSLDMFIIFLKDNSYSIFNINKNKYHYLSIVEKGLSNPSFINTVNEFMIHIFDNNMRMTLFELK